MRTATEQDDNTEHKMTILNMLHCFMAFTLGQSTRNDFRFITEITVTVIINISQFIIYYSFSLITSCLIFVT